MNIAIISTGMLPNPSVRGGAVETLTDLLIDYNEEYSKHNITLYSCYDSKAEKKSKNYRYCNFKYIKINKYIKEISRYFLYIINKFSNVYVGNLFMNEVVKDLKKNNNYDIVVVENTYQIGMLLKRNNINNIFLHLHNDYLNNQVKHSKKIFDSYSQILTISEFIKKRVETIGYDDKIVTLYNGIDTDKFNKDLYKQERRILRKKYGIDEKDIVIVFSGRLIQEKGIKELLQAFVNLKLDKSLKLMIIGSSVFEGSKKTPFVKQLEELANAKKDNIIFTGYVPNNEIASLYSVADIGVVPSIWEEPFGLTLVEQMSMSLPIIASDSGAIKEIINNDCGIIVKRDGNFVENLSNSISLLAENENIRRSMGESARKRAKDFNQKIYCENFYNIVKQYKQTRGIKND